MSLYHISFCITWSHGLTCALAVSECTVLPKWCPAWKKQRAQLCLLGTEDHVWSWERINPRVQPWLSLRCSPLLAEELVMPGWKCVCKGWERGQRELLFKEPFQKKLPMRLFFGCSIIYIAREREYDDILQVTEEDFLRFALVQRGPSQRVQNKTKNSFLH